MYLRGIGTPASIPEARRWLTLAADQGHSASMLLLGHLLLQESAEARAVELFRQAADLGNSDAQYNLGVCLRRGMGVAPDDQEAERRYTAAAKQGHPSAQLALGSMKAQTATTDQEWAEIANWYRMASEAGHPTAMLSLAQLLESGRGVPADVESALRLYQRAVGAGLSEAAAEVERVEAGMRKQS